ncbi:MAG TPA: hypothetical protein VEO54_06225 [Thermoanaerobaculia bacterium]|nr:hypothetical protein [Thermoanaerobaculia bacterium]
MLLNHEEIKNRQIIGNGVSTGYRGASYDLRVGKLIATDGTKVSESESYVLKPQGVIEVISAETVSLKGDVLGYAMVKTSLCNDGLLALNIGIIDPHYSGPISTTLLNFSKSDRPLNIGDVFLRLTFHECQPVSEEKAPPRVTAAEYERDRRRKAGGFGATFLHLDATVDEMIRSSVMRWASWFGLALAFITFMVNFALAYASYYLWRRDPFLADLLRRITTDQQQMQTLRQTDLVEQHRRLNSQQQELDKIRERLAALEQARPTPTASQKKP